MKKIQFIFMSLISMLFICFNCFASEKLEGKWEIKKIIANPVPENLVFLPKNIKIEFTGESEGNLRIQWHEEDGTWEDGNYAFSTDSTTFTTKTIRVFNTDTEKKYFKTDIRVFYSEDKGTFTFNLKEYVLIKSEAGEIEGLPLGSSSFLIHLHGEDLVFTYAGGNRIFKAFYFLKEK